MERRPDDWRYIGSSGECISFLKSLAPNMMIMRKNIIMGSPAVLGTVQYLPGIVRDHKISTVVSTISPELSQEMSSKLSKAGLTLKARNY